MIVERRKSRTKDIPVACYRGWRQFIVRPTTFPPFNKERLARNCNSSIILNSFFHELIVCVDQNPHEMGEMGIVQATSQIPRMLDAPWVNPTANWIIPMTAFRCSRKAHQPLPKDSGHPGLGCRTMGFGKMLWGGKVGSPP